MAKHKYRLHVNFVAGIIFGLCVGILLSTWCRNKFIPCAPSFSRSGCCADRLQLSFNVETKNDASRQNTSPVLDHDQEASKSNNIFIEEADEKGFLFVGVMTAKKYLDSRAVSAYNTWARSINGKVVFFSSEGSVSNYNIPVVSLKNVDDSYPPQKKSFKMLKYMSDNYLEKYEWFMRADDDIFIRGSRLETFLRSINSSKPQFIGQAGVGMKDEIGLLSLGDSDNYCMGGTGIVLSRETLRNISPHLKYCVSNLHTTHEDVEIGRCVRQYAGIPCTWAFEMQKLFYQNFKEYKGSFVDTLHDAEVQKAITLHPVKMPVHQYRVNNHFTANKILELRQKELLLQRDIADMNQVLNEPNHNVFNKYSRVPSVMTYRPQSGADILGWEYISSKAIVSHLNVNPRKGLSGCGKETLDIVVTQLADIINKNSRQRGRTIDFKEVLYGYVQTDPLNGASYILDVLLTYRKHKGKSMTVPVRRHAYLHQTFTQTEFIEDLWTRVGESDSPPGPLFNHFVGNNAQFEKRHKISETVHFILPLAGKVKEFRRFMSLFEEICLKPSENAQLHVVLFSKNSSPNEIEEILQIVGQYQKRYGGQLIEVIEADGDFARAQALDLGSKQCSMDDLLFCVDVDILLTPDCLNRIRLNTIQGVQVYYPIVFSQYDPDVICGNTSKSLCKIDLSDFQPKMGYWRQFGYGIAAMYRSDLEKVGGYDTSILGWGKEDVDLFGKFIEYNITVFRAVDTGMVHAWHSITCDVNLSAAQFHMCVGSKATTLASGRQLAEMVIKSDSILHRHEDGPADLLLVNYKGPTFKFAGPGVRTSAIFRHCFRMQKLFYQNFKEYKGSFVDTLHDAEVQKAITLHPVKMPVHQYRVNNHFTANKILELRQKELLLQRDIADMNQVLNEPNHNVFNKYSRVPSVMTYRPQSGADILGWEYISSKAIVSHLNVNPRKGLSGCGKETLDIVVTQLADIINKNSRQRGRTIDFKEVLYGYVQTDPLNGASYILDVLLTYRKHKGKSMTVPVRRHAYLHQTFTQTEFIEDLWTRVGESDSPPGPLFNHFVGNNAQFEKRHKISETVHFILPLAGKVKEFRRFMSLFEEICLKPSENAQLHVVLFSKNSSPNEIEEILQIVGQYQKRYGGQLIEVIEADGDFARAQALDLGSKQCSMDDLLFCVDVDILLTPDCLNRIRLNTIQGVQVYYPIVFSQYDPDVICGNTSKSLCKIDLSDFQPKMGYWRQFGYGIAAMYRSDLEKVGGYDTSILGWGKEDVDLFGKFIEYNITVFRAVDTGMVHAWHSITCDVNLSAAQFHMCVGSKATTLASGRQLAEMVIKSDSILHRHEDGQS